MDVGLFRCVHKLIERPLHMKRIYFFWNWLLRIEEVGIFYVDNSEDEKPEAVLSAQPEKKEKKKEKRKKRERKEHQTLIKDYLPNSVYVQLRIQQG